MSGERSKQNADTGDTERIHRFLTSQKFGGIGTVNSEGNPCVTVVFYTIDDRFNVTFTTKSQTKLYQNLQHSNRVMLLVYDVPSQITVQITGTVQKTALNNALENKKSISDFRPPIAKLNAGEPVTCKLRPTNINMKVYAGDEAETTNLNFS